MTVGNYIDNKKYLNNLLNILEDSYNFMNENKNIYSFDLKTSIEIMKKNNLNDDEILKAAKSIFNTNKKITLLSNLQLNWSNNYPTILAEKYTRDEKNVDEYKNIINEFKNKNILTLFKKSLFFKTN